MLGFDVMGLIPSISIIFGGLFLIICSVVIVKFGDLLQKTPDKVNSSGQSLSSPKSTNLMATGILWVIYLFGCSIIQSHDKILFIVGVISIFTANLFALHIVVFSAAVYNKMTNIKILGD